MHDKKSERENKVRKYKTKEELPMKLEKREIKEMGNENLKEMIKTKGESKERNVE